MSIFSTRWIQSLLIVGCLLVVAPAEASVPAKTVNCFLTNAQISEIKFHYNLDKYMVAGCIVGGVFGAITGLLSLSGISIIASVPYIATGCSLGFLIGGSGVVMYKLFAAPEQPSTKPPIRDTWNETP